METQNEKIQNERDTELYEDGEKKKLEIELKKQLGTIESGKFKQIVDAIGSETIIDIANAGPELQAKLLEGLGLQGYLMMDSNNPINLFSAADGMVRPSGME